jgi:hypothetical protein
MSYEEEDTCVWIHACGHLSPASLCIMRSGRSGRAGAGAGAGAAGTAAGRRGGGGGGGGRIIQSTAHRVMKEVVAERAERDRAVPAHHVCRPN